MRRTKTVLLLALFTITAVCFARDVDLSRLKLPPGFRIELFTETGGKPRLLVFSPGGVLLASLMNEGKIVAFPDPRHTGKAERAVTVVEELNAPHGMAFHEGKLYVAETNRVVRYDWNEQELKATNAKEIVQVPRSGMHFTRTILIANNKLYVSIGSDCNVCNESDERRATVMEYNLDGSGQRVFARGLRNAVGLAWNDKTASIWTTENGRDWLGDDLPPDEINNLGKSGGDFGWPACYGDRVIDPEHKEAGAKRCPNSVAPQVKLQAHSAPLGLAFNTSKQFPAEYAGDLFVALHGSWNRSVPTGYKVVRIHLKNGTDPEPPQDFITGWLAPGETRRGQWMGRPVGIAFGPDGAMYVSDDFAGPIYRVTYGK